MPLETGSFINDLTPSNPPGSDPAGQGDDHLRLIKTTVQGTFPQMGTQLGRVVRQDVAVSISSTWNTNHFVCSASATATVVLTLPPASSITSGYYVDITTIGTGTVSLLPSGAASINGGVSLSIPRLNTAHVYFAGGTSWLADVAPHGNGGAIFGDNVFVGGTLTVSGATGLAALTVNGVATLSGAVHMKSTLSISGATTMAGTLSVSGLAVLNTLQVNGIATFSAAVFMNTTLRVAGIASISSGAVIHGGAIINGSVSISGATVLTGLLTTTNGQIAFPAVQNPSAGANTLDDYEEGTWTPSLSFTTPGDLGLTYGTRSGDYTKIGRNVTCWFGIVTTSYAFTTASGNLLVTGLPFAPVLGPGQTPGKTAWQGLTKANYTELDWTCPNGATDTQFVASGSGQARSNMQAGNTASGTQITLYANTTFIV